MKYGYKVLITTGAMLVSPMALAHEQSLTSGFIAGLLHPLTGIDHLVAFLLAGLLIGRLVSAQWVAVGSMLLALGSGMAGALLLGAQAWTEAAVLLSLPTFFAMQWIRNCSSAKFVVMPMSLFMIAHGWSHGADLAGLNYAFVFGLLMMSAAVMLVFSIVGNTMKAGSPAVSHALR